MWPVVGEPGEGEGGGGYGDGRAGVAWRDGDGGALEVASDAGEVSGEGDGLAGEGEELAGAEAIEGKLLCGLGADDEVTDESVEGAERQGGVGGRAVALALDGGAASVDLEEGVEAVPADMEVVPGVGFDVDGVGEARLPGAVEEEEAGEGA